LPASTPPVAAAEPIPATVTSEMTRLGGLVFKENVAVGPLAPNPVNLPTAPLVHETGSKKKKEKQLPKEQTSGMSPKDVQACKSIIKKLLQSKHSVIFRQPVDPVRDHAPG
jgi:hypothetical protein